MVRDMRTVQLGDEVCEMQCAHKREVPGFLAKETRLLVLRCVLLTSSSSLS